MAAVSQQLQQGKEANVMRPSDALCPGPACWLLLCPLPLKCRVPEQICTLVVGSRGQPRKSGQGFQILRFYWGKQPLQ